MKGHNSVNDYLAGLPKTARERLGRFSEVIRKAAPREAEDVINYNMPALRWHGILVWYAALKGHIGFVRGLPRLSRQE